MTFMLTNINRSHPIYLRDVYTHTHTNINLFLWQKHATTFVLVNTFMLPAIYDTDQDIGDEDSDRERKVSFSLSLSSYVCI